MTTLASGPRTAPGLVRFAGAALAAILAVVVFGLLYFASANPAIESLTYMRETFDSPGGTAFQALAWAAAPIAAGTAGWLFAIAASQGARWVGVSLGVATYALSLLLLVGGVNLAYPSTPDAGLSNRLFSIFVQSPVEVALVGLVTAPTLIACLAAGAIWERLVRRVVPTPPDLGARTSAYTDLAKLIAIYGVLACLASLAMHLILASLTGLSGSD